MLFILSRWILSVLQSLRWGGGWTFGKVKQTDDYELFKLLLYLKFGDYITRNSSTKSSFIPTVDGNLKSTYQLLRSFASLIGILFDGLCNFSRLRGMYIQDWFINAIDRHSQVWFLRAGAHKHVPNGRSAPPICTRVSLWISVTYVCVCLIFIPGKEISLWHVDMCWLYISFYTYVCADAGSVCC